MGETATTSRNRIQKLLAAMNKRAWADRSGEWFKQDQFADIGEAYKDEAIIIRRARAIEEMLMSMADPEKSQQTHTFEIREDELIVGVIALGSLGLGKAFPNYLTEEEKRAGSLSSKTQMALFGHNSVNYEGLLSKGLNGIIQDCERRKKEVDNKIQLHDTLLAKLESFIDNSIRDLRETDFADFIPHKNNEEEELGFRLKTYDTRMPNMVNQFLSVQNDDEAVAKQNEYVLSIKKKLNYKRNLLHDKEDFYRAVIIACQSVIEYARKYADLAEELAGNVYKDEKRKKELMRIAEVCRKVPAEPATNFHEALQSIYFYHLAQHSCMNQLSLGRLDQTLKPFYNPAEREAQLELLECFLIKCAERLILDSETFVKQDHVDFASSLVTTPVELDQWAEANEFLQNIIIGGLTRDGKDAVNECSYLILEAFRNTGIYTPTINARISPVHINDSKKEFIKAVAETVFKTRNGMPTIGNDNVIMKALQDAGVPLEEARDYVIDGCWEPLLNGTGDWTFRMFNMLTALECALNGGAGLSTNPSLLRGQKISYKTPVPDSYEQLEKNLQTHIQFFTDRAALSIYSLYLIDQAINPTPLYSALLAGCLETGRDKTWGGAKYRLAGILAAGVPDTINLLAAVKKWVFENRTFSLGDVTEALRDSFDAAGNREKQIIYDKIKLKFLIDSYKFGDNDSELNTLMESVLTMYYHCTDSSRKLAEEVFLKKPDVKDEKRISSLRCLAGYAGKSMQEEFGEDFDVKMTVGFGTFELFTLMGGGNAASADREKAGAPLARNFTPMEGTTKYSVGHLLASFKEIGLNRFGGGVITDICLEENDLYNKGEAEAVKQIMAIIETFIANNGNMLTLTIADRQKLLHIYNLCENARNGNGIAQQELVAYENINVRVAGYQAPFITLPKQHQASYIQRPVSP